MNHQHLTEQRATRGKWTSVALQRACSLGCGILQGLRTSTCDIQMTQLQVLRIQVRGTLSWLSMQPPKLAESSVRSAARCTFLLFRQRWSPRAGNAAEWSLERAEPIAIQGTQARCQSTVCDEVKEVSCLYAVCHSHAAPTTDTARLIAGVACNWERSKHELGYARDCVLHMPSPWLSNWPPCVCVTAKAVSGFVWVHIDCVSLSDMRDLVRLVKKPERLRGYDKLSPNGQRKLREVFGKWDDIGELAPPFDVVTFGLLTLPSPPTKSRATFANPSSLLSPQPQPQPLLRPSLAARSSAARPRTCLTATTTMTTSTRTAARKCWTSWSRSNSALGRLWPKWAQRALAVVRTRQALASKSSRSLIANAARDRPSPNRS